MTRVISLSSLLALFVQTLDWHERERKADVFTVK